MDQEAIQEKIDSGLIQLFTKQWGAKKPEDPVGEQHKWYPGGEEGTKLNTSFIQFPLFGCSKYLDAYSILFIESYDPISSYLYNPIDKPYHVYIYTDMIYIYIIGT